jgi:hypothetical protein
MNPSLELLRNALLLSLLLLFVYILYRRLLSTLKRRNALPHRYAGFAGKAIEPGSYPDAFRVHFQVPEEQHVRIYILDEYGNEALIVADEVIAPGEHSREFRSSSLAPGNYFCLIHSLRQTSTRRFTVGSGSAETE